VVVLKWAVDQLLVLPVPGYWDLPICHAFLTKGSTELIDCPSDEEIYKAYVDEKQEDVRSLVLNAASACIRSLMKRGDELLPSILEEKTRWNCS